MYELEVEKGQDIFLVEGFREVEVKGVDGFDGWEGGLRDTVFNEYLLSFPEFLLSEDEEGICRGEVIDGGFFQGFFEDVCHALQTEGKESFFKCLDFHCFGSLLFAYWS